MITHSRIKKTKINAVTMSRQISCPSSTSITALLTAGCVVRFSKYVTSDSSEGKRVVRLGPVDSSDGGVAEKYRVIQRRRFGKSNRISLMTRKSSVEKVKIAETGVKIPGIALASSVLMAAFDRLPYAMELLSDNESFPSELAVEFTAAPAPAPIPADETQLPSASQNRPRQTCLIDHGSHPSQTNPTIKNRVHLSRPRALWMTSWRRKRATGSCSGIDGL